MAVTSLSDPRGSTAGRVLVLRDVSERREYERNLRRLAYTDSLTGLPNRALFYDRLNQALVMSRRTRWHAWAVTSSASCSPRSGIPPTRAS
jgi:predicted signal transduction protein with EAL and GGDEF domain